MSAADRPIDTMSAKLRAALEYLGDRLVTHRASRFRPVTRYLLDEWRAARTIAAARDPCAAAGHPARSIIPP
jgi:hypothetical protein